MTQNNASSVELARDYMKITVRARKPRNPLVAAARFRRAGSHQETERSLRQRANRDLKKELDRAKDR
jgi:hypothetical protein